MNIGWKHCTCDFRAADELACCSPCGQNLTRVELLHYRVLVVLSVCLDPMISIVDSFVCETLPPRFRSCLKINCAMLRSKSLHGLDRLVHVNFVKSDTTPDTIRN